MYHCYFLINYIGPPKVFFLSFRPLFKKFAHHWYSLLLLGYKPVQHVTVLNTVGNCNTIVLKYYNLMGSPPYMRSVVDRNVAMRCILVLDDL